ncbi:MAG: hypothetical protein WKG07_15985 [Hymenobacter sp.]
MRRAPSLAPTQRPARLRFNFPARTSRGALAEHMAWYLHLRDSGQPRPAGCGRGRAAGRPEPRLWPGF